MRTAGTARPPSTRTARPGSAGTARPGSAGTSRPGSAGTVRTAAVRMDRAAAGRTTRAQRARTHDPGLRDTPLPVRAWHDSFVVVLVVLLIVAAFVLVGVVVVAIGRGGEMTRFPSDVRPLDADIETAADVVLLRPPGSLWGYDKRATDDALNMVARTVTERDVEIATLRRQLADIQSASDESASDQPAAPDRARKAWEPDPSRAAGQTTAAGYARQPDEYWAQTGRRPDQPREPDQARQPDQ